MRLGFYRRAVLLLLTLAGGCSMETRELSERAFQTIYDAPRRPTLHIDYLGVRDGYHYLAYYGPSASDVHGSNPNPDIGLRGYFRTPVSAMPADFPDHPQNPIREETAEEEAENMRKAFDALEARRKQGQ